MTASSHDDAVHPAPPEPNPERMVPLKEACRYAHWSRDTAYKLIHEGKIDAYKDGRRTFIDLDTVDRYKRTLPKIAATAAA